MPRRVPAPEKERNKLVKFGSKLGKALSPRRSRSSLASPLAITPCTPSTGEEATGTQWTRESINCLDQWRINYLAHSHQQRDQWEIQAWNNAARKIAGDDRDFAQLALHRFAAAAVA
jgi:hypothetical protein